MTCDASGRCCHPGCAYATSRRNDLNKHIVKHSGSKPFTCKHEGCTFASGYARALAHHKWVHRSDRPLKCDKPGCNFQTSNSGNLADHKSTHLGLKSHVCDFPGCQYSTAHSGALTNHRYTHTGEKLFQCQEADCDFSATNASILRIHRMQHEGVKPYVCEYADCTYASRNTGHLERHIRKHTGEKPYRCMEPDCVQAFTSNTDLQRHMTVHTGEKPFRCTETGCNQARSSSSDLRRHMRTHTGEKPYKCSECDYACAQRYNLKEHFQAWHSEEASRRKKLQELRVADALNQAGIPFRQNVYICCRSLGGTFRLVDFVLYTKHGIIYLEIGKLSFLGNKLSHFVICSHCCLYADEYGHQRYGIWGECERMHLIYEKQLLREDSRPAVFIRYNPNTYMKQGFKQLVSRTDTEQAEEVRSARERTLIQKIREMEFGRDKTLQVLYMYYDCHCPFTPDAEHRYYLDIWRDSQYCAKLLSVCLPVIV